MLVLTPVSALHSGYYAYPSVDPMPTEPSYLDAFVGQAALDYAVAHARAEAIRRQNQELHRRQVLQDLHQLEEQRLQVALEAFYQQLPSSSDDRAFPYFRPSSYPSPQELYILREQQRRAALARQQEQYALSLAQARERAAADRTHRANEQQLISALAALGFSVHQPDLAGPQNGLHMTNRAYGRPSASAGVRCRHTAQPTSSATASIQDRLRDRYRHETDLDVRNTVEHLSSMFGLQLQGSSSTPIDIKGKGKARETPAVPKERPATIATPIPTSSSSNSYPSTSTAKRLSLRDLLQRSDKEADPEVKESLQGLFSKIYGTHDREMADEEATTPISNPPTIDLKGKGKETILAEDVSLSHAAKTETGATSIGAPADAPVASSEPADGPKLHRRPVASPATAAKILSFFRSRRDRKESLSAIKEIEDTLRALEASFVFPSRLDFSPPASPSASGSNLSKELGAQNGLMYTANNTVVHAYEHSLNGLLTRLDAVDSRGDIEIRGRRKEVVQEVERALREVERRVEESRERDNAKGIERDAQPTAAPSTHAAQEGSQSVSVDDHAAKSSSPALDRQIPSSSGALDGSVPALSETAPVNAGPVTDSSTLPAPSHAASVEDTSPLPDSVEPAIFPPPSSDQYVTTSTTILTAQEPSPGSETLFSAESPTSSSGSRADQAIRTADSDGRAEADVEAVRSSPPSVSEPSVTASLNAAVDPENSGALPVPEPAADAHNSPVVIVAVRDNSAFVAPARDTEILSAPPVHDEVKPIVADVYEDTKPDAHSDTGSSCEEGGAFLLSSQPLEVTRHAAQLSPSTEEMEVINHDDAVDGSEWEEVGAESVA